MIIGIILLMVFIPINKYRELNYLKIIDKIDVQCIDNGYKVALFEIIPVKEDNGIKYKYKKYQELGKDLAIIKKKINNKDIFYYGSIKTITTNCHNTDYILKTFKINKYKIIKQ